MSHAHDRLEGLREACHDIRQPVAGVFALAGAALTEPDLPEKARDCLKQIVRLAEWQSDVIEHWLQAPEVRWPKTDRTDVLSVVSEAVETQRVTWEGDLTLLWPPESVFVGLPRVTMRRMAANLLANATRAAGPSGRVTVEVSPRAAQVLLVVEDDGPGFGRLPKGFGLGLSAVAREAIACHGKLECGHGDLGGARVSLCLPTAGPQKGGGWRMRLVLCDDNRILCEALASVFEAHGHQVLAIATSASEGVAAVSMLKPDVCLLDVRLPDGSGLDAARAMRRRCPDTKIAVLSCLDDPAAVAEAKKAGAAGFLRKDLKADAILSALDVIDAGGVAFGPKYSGPASWRAAATPRDDLLGTLTPREAQVLQRIVEGQNTCQMASEMDVATSTLRSYIKNVLAKLGAHSRLQAAAIANQEPGLLTGPTRSSR